MLGAVTLLVGCFVGFIGFVVFLLGVLALFTGIHGGVLAATVMTLLGAGLLFLGFYAGRYGHRAMRDQQSGSSSTMTASPDNAVDSDTVRSPPCAPPGARHRER